MAAVLETDCVGSIGGVITFLGVMMGPLRAPLLRTIYGESVEITVQTSAEEVRPDEMFSLKAIGRPTSFIAATDGQVNLSFDRTLIKLLGDQSTLLRKIPPLESTTELYDEPLWFRAGGTEGETLITVDLTTSYGNTYQGSKRVRIIRPTAVDSRHPTRENFVGEWVLQIGDRQGFMTLARQSQEGHGQIEGVYTFPPEPGSPALSGKILGTKDGETFTARLTPDTTDVTPKQDVNANCCLDADGYVKIRGRVSAASQACKDFSAWAQAERGVANCVAGKWWKECGP